MVIIATSSSTTLDNERTHNATLRAGVPSGEVVEVSGGFREAFEGEIADFDCQPVYPGSQNGYDFIATSVSRLIGGAWPMIALDPPEWIRVRARFHR